MPVLGLEASASWPFVLSSQRFLWHIHMNTGLLDDLCWRKKPSPLSMRQPKQLSGLDDSVGGSRHGVPGLVRDARGIDTSGREQAELLLEREPVVLLLSLAIRKVRVPE